MLYQPLFVSNQLIILPDIQGDLYPNFEYHKLHTELFTLQYINLYCLSGEIIADEIADITVQCVCDWFAYSVTDKTVC